MLCRCRVLEHLRRQIEWIRTRDVDDVARFAVDRIESRHDESGVRRQTQGVNPRDDFVAQRRIEINAIPIGENARGLEMSFPLDALYLPQEPADALLKSARI